MRDAKPPEVWLEWGNGWGPVFRAVVRKPDGTLIVGKSRETSDEAWDDVPALEREAS